MSVDLWLENRITDALEDGGTAKLLERIHDIIDDYNEAERHNVALIQRAAWANGIEAMRKSLLNKNTGFRRLKQIEFTGRQRNRIKDLAGRLTEQGPR